MIEKPYVRHTSSQMEQLVIENTKVIIRNSRLSKIGNLLKYLGPAFIVSVAYIDPPVLSLEYCSTYL